MNNDVWSRKTYIKLITAKTNRFISIYSHIITVSTQGVSAGTFAGPVMTTFAKYHKVLDTSIQDQANSIIGL